MSNNPSSESIQPARQHGAPEPLVAYPLIPGENTQQPITQQPVARQPESSRESDGEEVLLPKAATARIPAGLRSLATIDQLMVEQKVGLLEAFTGWESNNKYIIKNTRGEKLFYALEESDACDRQCCGSLRQFQLRILDISQNNAEVIHLYRDFTCSCFPCCLQKLEVCSHGNLVGTVEQTWDLCNYCFDVKDENGATVLKIEGSACIADCCPSVDFVILSADGSREVGKISKHWSGLAREIFTDADHFGISFPSDLDVRIKAVLIGACFLIDFMCFENNNGDC